MFHNFAVLNILGNIIWLLSDYIWPNLFIPLIKANNYLCNVEMLRKRFLKLKWFL